MKDCSENQIRNPKTNRCVKKDGKIGKALLAQKDSIEPQKPKKPPSPKPSIKTTPKSTSQPKLPPELTQHILDLTYKKDIKMKAKARVLNKDMKKRIQYSDEAMRNDKRFHLAERAKKWLKPIVGASHQVDLRKQQYTDKLMHGIPLFQVKSPKEFQFHFDYNQKRYGFKFEAMDETTIFMLYTTHSSTHGRILASYNYYIDAPSFECIRPSQQSHKDPFLYTDETIELPDEQIRRVMTEMNVLLELLIHKYKRSLGNMLSIVQDHTDILGGVIYGFIPYEKKHTDPFMDR